MAIWTPTASQKPKTKKLSSQGCEHRYEIEVPPARVQEALQNVFVRLQLQARIAGFRPGKAPLDIIKKQYGETARGEAAEQIIREVIPDALKELDLRPVAIPSVGNIDLPADGPMRFELRVEVAPRIEPKGYTGIAVKRAEYPVTDAEVEARVQHLRDGNARLEKAAADAAGKEHYVVLDYELLRGGELLPDGKGASELVDMSSDQTVDGLTEGLLGAKAGEPREFPVSVDGKPAVCKAVVREIKTKILPALDDEFAKDMGVDSVAKLQEELRKLIAQENEERSDREVSSQIEAALLGANRFEVPRSLAEQQLEHMLKRLESRLLGPNRSLPEKQASELREKLAPQAEDQVRLQLLIGAIAEKEGVAATDEDFEKERAAALEKAENEDQRKKSREFFERGKDEILAAIRERKVIRMIRDSAKITVQKA